MPLHENSIEASVGFDFDAVEGTPGEAPKTHTLDDMLEFGRKLIRFIRSKDRARLTVDCLHLALGDSEAKVKTMTDVGDENGVTKAAVSKRTKEVREQLHLSINANNKSARAVEKYRNNRSPLRLKGST